MNASTWRAHLLGLALAAGLGASPASAAATAPLWNDLQLTALDGKTFDPGQLAGHVVLVVNVASFCSYTPQYAELERLYTAYADKGLVVLGVPCNQFGGQEPGTAAEIRNFCSTRYGVTFPLLSKQDVNGDTRSPLYRWLVERDPSADRGKDIGWNFTKFLVGRDGSVMARYGSDVVPTDARLRAAIELALSQGS
ncbi:MAG: glutathione peroxidase [Alphaproteobacteria bacterium]|nr:glutathione peroxidase [Alphaproteobacteria bacterium]